MSQLPPSNPARRRLLAGIAASTASAGVLAACGGSSADDNDDGGSLIGGDGSPAPLPQMKGLPAPEDSGIDHIVVVMMENRSFDHYFGWLAGANGQQAGLNFKDKSGATVASFPLATSDGYGYQSCGQEDPNHSYDGGRLHYNDGRMDGFLQTVSADGDHFPVGYFGADDLPFFKGVAEQWTVCDRYFSGILSSTYPNRIYMHTGQTDRNSNSTTASTLPAIWDRLAAKGLTGTYYFNDLPLTALFGTRFLTISQPYAAFLAAAALGTLPSVSYVDPSFGGELTGTSNDDHPLADVRNGQAFLNQIYNALRNGPNWEKTLLIINYDEWGGFYDHVPPPLAPVSTPENSVVGNDGRLGFRVPCVLAGPRVRKGHIDSDQYDPNSILNLISWRFGLDGLGVRSQTSKNLAYALDFNSAPRSDKPAFDVAAGPFGTVCQLATILPQSTSLSALQSAERSAAEHFLDLETLRMIAKRSGFSW
jgi:phospholipase C